jgi:hypothetical protein
MSRIAATYTEDAHGVGAYDNGVAFCPRVPAVIYQARLGGAATRVERDGKGDHLSLIRSGRVELIVASSGGVVGQLGYSHSSDSWIVEAFGPTDFAQPGSRAAGWWTEHATREDAIGEAGLAWIS